MVCKPVHRYISNELDIDVDESITITLIWSTTHLGHPELAATREAIKSKTLKDDDATRRS